MKRDQRVSEIIDGSACGVLKDSARQQCCPGTDGVESVCLCFVRGLMRRSDQQRPPISNLGLRLKLEELPDAVVSCRQMHSHRCSWIKCWYCEEKSSLKGDQRLVSKLTIASPHGDNVDSTNI